MKNWYAEDSFRRSLAEGTMLPDAFASTVNACGRSCLANCRLLIHPVDMLARIYTTMSRLCAVGYSTVVVKMESRRVEGRSRGGVLMSTSSVFNRPYFPWSITSRGPQAPRPKSGRESAHDHGRNLRQTISSHPESLHSSHSKPPARLPSGRPTPSLTRQTRFLALSSPR